MTEVPGGKVNAEEQDTEKKSDWVRGSDRRLMRYTPEEKLENIHLLEHSERSIKAAPGRNGHLKVIMISMI